jgi:D-alanyl-D-alanine carboxypeptidase
MRRLVILALLAGCSHAPAATATDAAVAADAASGVDLSSTLAPIAAQAGLPALAALASDDTTILGDGVTGVRKLGDPTLATMHDTWHLGSDTKAMTATLTAEYVDAGTLAWDTTVAVAFPGLTIDPGYQQVTIAMLLAHVGGAPAEMPDDVQQVLEGSGTPQALRLQAVTMLLARPPGATVGSYAYANAGYIIVGAALEQATGIAWEQLMRDKIFAPLGMTSCGFGPNATGTMVDEPWGHEVENGTVVAVNEDNPPSYGPAGTVHCALVDWLAFLRDHLDSARGMPTVLGLAPATWTMLHTPWPGSTGDYALGWIVASRDWAGGVALTHVGDNTLNVADAWIAPGIDRIFIATTNRGDQPALDAADTVIGDLVALFPAQ